VKALELERETTREYFKGLKKKKRKMKRVDVSVDEPIDEPIETSIVEPIVEPIESVRDIPPILWKKSLFPCNRIKTLLIEAYYQQDTFYELVKDCDSIVVVSTIHNNFYRERYDHFGIRINLKGLTTDTLHIYIEDESMIYYTRIVKELL